MKIKIFVEGGGDGSTLKTECRRGFSTFFERAGMKGRMPSVLACGSRNEAYSDFCTAVMQAVPDVLPLLLVDSEDAITQSPWAHLKTRDNWDKPAAATDEQVHLMVRCMESWFLADRSQLAKYFNQGFDANALPAGTNVESIDKDTLMNALKHASRQCKTKSRYDKGEHSFEILSMIDPEVVAKASPHAERLLKTLRANIAT